MADKGQQHDQSQDAASSAGILPSHGISLNVPTASDDERPPLVKHMSNPTYASPLRHHKRGSSRNKPVKETLDAHSSYGGSSDDGHAVHRVNQYIIKEEIGRGSFGAVHLAVDQYGTEYVRLAAMQKSQADKQAVKEFSKSRLRKRAQSNLLRRPNQKRPSVGAGLSFNAPMSRQSLSDRAANEPNNSLDLIKEEIAIMKKLNHNNVVALIEVMDDPGEDSLYMVMEMCKKGVSMKVDLEETADPYDEETCRCWFRDMILGVEYLHHQGIVHRDIKPDNCLINHEDVLKIVDFGVSEMFEKTSSMATTKSAGSPAFLPPELCVAKHGEISGRAADIWSMGVTLYCLRNGKIPFEKSNMLELYEAIRGEDPPLENEQDKSFKDLMIRILEKDPEKRIKMPELRDHPWVTKNGEDPLLSEEENCADVLEPPTEQEMNHAITGNMGNLLVVMKAVNRFKSLLHNKRPELINSVFGSNSRLVAPPESYKRGSNDTPETNNIKTSRSVDAHDRKPIERALTVEGVHHDLDVDEKNVVSPRTGQPQEDQPSAPSYPPTPSGEGTPTPTPGRQAQEAETKAHHPEALRRNQTAPLERVTSDGSHRGQAHDPLTDRLFLAIGAGPNSPPPAEQDGYAVTESPGNAEMNVYEVAYEEELQRILKQKNRDEPFLYMNRRLDHRQDLRKHENIISHSRSLDSGVGGKGGGLANLVKMAAQKEAGPDDKQQEERPKKNAEEKDESGSRGGGGGGGGGSLASLVKEAAQREAGSQGQDDKQQDEEPKKNAESGSKGGAGLATLVKEQAQKEFGQQKQGDDAQSKDSGS